MLLKGDALKGIASGTITLAFRRWKRPTVRAGGTLLTAVGRLAILAVDEVVLGDITAADARAAGFENLDDLRAVLGGRPEGRLFRVRLSLAGPDPRIALRNRPPSVSDIEDIRARLERLDRTARAPWTIAVLDAIRARPATYSGDLASRLGMDPARFKARVRTLKAMGLTESLEVGYRLSPRGRAALRRVSAGAARSPVDDDGASPARRRTRAGTARPRTTRGRRT